MSVPTLENQTAQRIALSDNKHDFSKVFDKDIFYESSIACIDRGEGVMNEDVLLKTLFQLERTSDTPDKLFKYEEGFAPPYQIHYNSYFPEFMSNMENNPFIVIDMDLGGFSNGLLSYLLANPMKTCTLYNGLEVKYDPAGKSTPRTFIRKGLTRIGKSTENGTQLIQQIKVSNLSRNSLSIDPKRECDTSFQTIAQHFFTNRNIRMNEYAQKAFSFIEKETPNHYYMFDKSFANKTLSVLNKTSFKKCIRMIQEAVANSRDNVLDYLRSKQIITPEKGSSEHYLAKRLGDAGQAIASREIHDSVGNSVLVTHDRVLLAFALFIKVPRIVFTHPNNTSREYPISIFERNDMLNPETQKQNTFTNIRSQFYTISRKTNGFNIPELKREFTDYTTRIQAKQREYADRINGLLEEIIRLLNNPTNVDTLTTINALYKELISTIYILTPLLRVDTTFSVSDEEIRKVLAVNIETATLDDLNQSYAVLHRLHTIVVNLEQMKLLEVPIEMTIAEQKSIQLVRNTTRLRRIRNMFKVNDKERVESRIESQLKLNILNDYFTLVSGGNADIITRFLETCRQTDFLEGGNYAKEKIRMIQTKQTGGNIRDKGQNVIAGTNRQTVRRPNAVRASRAFREEAAQRQRQTRQQQQLQRRRIGQALRDDLSAYYTTEEYIVAYIRSISVLLTFDEKKFTVFKEKYFNLYTSINKTLFTIGEIYNWFEARVEETDLDEYIITRLRQIYEQINRITTEPRVKRSRSRSRSRKIRQRSRSRSRKTPEGSRSRSRSRSRKIREGSRRTRRTRDMRGQRTLRTRRGLRIGAQ